MDQAITKPSPDRADDAFFGHPRGLSTLFFTELWERFSYYGMRALLILFMTAPAAGDGLGFDVASAGAIYGLFTSMVYLLSLPGGWVADRFLGQRRAVLYGGILIAAGNFLLVVHRLPLFFLGLLVIAVGTGLLKPNVSTIVGHLYRPGDARRDSGFSIFYMGINLGAFLAPLACGYLGQRINWHLGFALAGIGMSAGTIQYLLGGKHLGDAGLHPARTASPDEEARTIKRLVTGIVSAIALIATFAVLTLAGAVQFTPQAVSDIFGIGLLLAVLGVFAWILFGRGWTAEERKRLVVVIGLFAAATVFWSVFEQAGSTLNLFADRNTDKRVLGYAFPASWFQSLNALFIVSLAPVFAWLWIRMGSREPSSPTKFLLGLVSAGLGFAVLIPPAFAAMEGEQVRPLWLVLTYLFHTCGELCLSPVGLSAMTKLAPARVGGFLMGVWFLSIAVGNYLGGRLASLYEALALPTLFSIAVGFSLAAALLLAAFVKPMKRLMGGVK
ncbi:MAG: peptide MFS transporter [Bryobacteraceae bacterium]|nr:peptide MFS transporter [Bryobacteraceae bacterium]